MNDYIPVGAYLDELQASIQKAENGFVVAVRYPQRSLAAPMSEMGVVFESLAEATGKADFSPQELLATIAKSGKKAQESKKQQLRKPMETYVFQNIDQVNAFIKELFSSQG